jgi:hypothetical protein
MCVPLPHQATSRLAQGRRQHVRQQSYPAFPYALVVSGACDSSCLRFYFYFCRDTNVELTASSMELKENTVIIVLGASGDLAKKKTVRSNPPSCIWLVFGIIFESH